ncbi:DUF2894 domain-containing protein [Massilia sp. PAMC28688]|uniref:DUF2894 domain-containing protein n=1 Tax=Massilia sp. PAMC28688 TaxID=2861283 RepID=UPI001C62CBE9|nr:DUF2894 domain-containing protein [Massilia sp. PAMC28688]QYF93341.1 DUF2894 domain-containing protein [Massilia sp. PAMC28688]
MTDPAPPVMDAAGSAAQEDIAALLANLKDQGGPQFDGPGWHYLDVLSRRASHHQGSARGLLKAKLAQAAAAFAQRFAQARADAQEVLDGACLRYPHAATQLRGLYASSDYKGLRHLVASLGVREQGLALAGLVSQLEPALIMTAGQGPTTRISTRGTASLPPVELKTVRDARATWARLSVDRQLSMAMQQAPKNAGPINSHMLVLRALAMMQSISPDYMNRMVSYVDTLLALDPGEIEVPVKRKRAAPAKAGKPARAAKK